jgi:hypothetical protein
MLKHFVILPSKLRLLVFINSLELHFISRSNWDCIGLINDFQFEDTNSRVILTSKRKMKEEG